MCEELNLEENLEEGKRHALALAEHMREMGAQKATIPVFIEDEEYEITVSHIPVKEANDSK